MLRNLLTTTPLARFSTVLNEVLSLNAQEFPARTHSHRRHALLNEVLSLNAQELSAAYSKRDTNRFLNEVLSLNAQEFRPPVSTFVLGPPSSMKS